MKLISGKSGKIVQILSEVFLKYTLFFLKVLKFVFNVRVMFHEVNVSLK